MSRQIVSEKDGFRVTWLTKKNVEVQHLWWHWFFRIVQGITVESNIKGVNYIRSRMWVTTCKKCDFKMIQVRELWLPNEKIPDDEGELDASIELAKVMKGLNQLEANQ